MILAVSLRMTFRAVLLCIWDLKWSSFLKKCVFFPPENWCISELRRSWLVSRSIKHRALCLPNTLRYLSDSPGLSGHFSSDSFKKMCFFSTKFTSEGMNFVDLLYTVATELHSATEIHTHKLHSATFSLD